MNPKPFIIPISTGRNSQQKCRMLPTLIREWTKPAKSKRVKTRRRHYKRQQRENRHKGV